MKIPIRIRLTAVYCTLFCLITVVLETGAWIGINSAINAVVDSELRARLGGVENFLNQHMYRKTLTVLQGELKTHAALQPQYLEIDNAQGDGIFRAPAMAPFTGASHLKRSLTIWTVNGSPPLRVLTVRRIMQNTELDLHLATDLTVPFEILRRFRLLLVLSVPIVLLGASAAGHWVSKRALEPVSILNAAARSITASSLNQRLAVPQSGDEAQALAETLNGMFVRIEEAFRRMTQFTANASHELRTPLALMRTTCEVALLRVNGNAETYREALQRILREAEKNSDLLDDMLSLARADLTSKVLALSPVELAPNIEQVCERVAPLAREKKIQLSYEALDGGAWVSAEPGHLRRLWLILLDNAIKFTPAGGTIRVISRTASPSSLVCEVRDSGIGIASSDLPHIFERFFRADKARSRDENGAGLGLSLARWIVEAHHGMIEVESVPGAGSMFRVLLPAFSRTQPAVPLASHPSDNHLSAIVSGREQVDHRH
jgi:heavy metal sensor kinase